MQPPSHSPDAFDPAVLGACRCAILLVQLLVAGIALLPTQKTSHALFVLALYPLSIVFVCAVEAAGFD